MKRGNLSDLAHRVFNKPAMILPAKYQTIIGVLQPRLGVSSLRIPGEAELQAADLQQLAATARAVTPKAEGAGRRKVFDQVGTIAVIPIEGTLVNKLGEIDPYSGMTGYDGIRVKLYEAVNDPDVAGILFDVNSPGGVVAGCFDLVDEIHALRAAKPIWAMASEDAYSAAYAIASAAEKIFLPRTGGVGSVGVICGHVDWSKHLEEDGIKVTMIFAGARKNDGSPYEPLSDEAYSWIKAEIDRTYGIFCATVARNRGLDEAKVRGTEAACFFGEGAVAAGLADEVAAPGEVLARMTAELAVGGFVPGGRSARRSSTQGKDSTMSKTVASGGRNGVISAAIALLAGAAAAENEDEKKDEAKDEKKDGASEQPKDEKKDEAKDEKKGEGEDTDEEKDEETASASAEKTRIAAILNAPEAKGREALARTLALETDLDPKAAIAALKVAPKAAGGPGSLAAAMEGEKPPVVGGENGKGDESADAVAARMAGYVNAPRKAK